MESNIENLEISLDRNLEIVFVDDSKENITKAKALAKSKFYDADETKKEVSNLDDCNDSILTLNKDDDNDETQISSESEFENNNEDNHTHVNVENQELETRKYKEPEQIDDKEFVELSSKDNNVNNSNEDLDKTLSNLTLNNTDNTNNNNNNKKQEEKKQISLKIDTTSVIEQPTKSQSLNSASSTGSKLSNLVPNFTTLFNSKGIRSFSSMYFNKVNRIANAEVLDSPTHTSADYGDDEVAFLLARLEEQNNLLQNDPKNSNFESLKANFQAIKNKEKDTDLDWDFWGKVMVDYEGVARKQTSLLTKKIRQGIPDSLRGTLWQLISKSKNQELEKTYAELLKENTTYEKIIRRDISRTFPDHDFFKDSEGQGQESLFNVMKVYSLYDKDLGYCQGLSFIVGPLLLNMPDEEAFCVLVRLMEGYDMRGLYTPNMEGLQLRLYQFDQLLNDILPKVSRHLEHEGIGSTMYASQWFMTLFAYKFPLELVFRILDVLFAEGYEFIFRIAFALLKKNQDFILEFEFDALLDFLKNGLFDIYDDDISELIKDASDIRISKRRLDKLANHFIQMTKEFDDNNQKMEFLKKENKELTTEIQKLHLAVESLTNENATLKNEIEDYRFEETANKTLIDALQKQIEESERLVAHTLRDSRKQAEEKVRIELDVLINKNIDTNRKNQELEDRVAELEQLLVEIKVKYAESEIEKDNYQRKWENLKRFMEK
jgi:cell division protein FtsB